MSTELRKLWGSGPLKINDLEIDAYVLDDGTPLIGKTKILKALGRPKKGDSNELLPSFISAKNLASFISDELREKLKGIDFLLTNKIANAYPADILPLICNVYLEARQAGKLQASQLPTAQMCEIIVRSLSRVGIAALVYEQLGFEKYKHPDALRMLIESYLAEEVRMWSKEFPEELFKQMDRIYGNARTTSRNRPMYYAKFLRKYIYDPIEKGLVLHELDKKNPRGNTGTRKHRHHSLLSEEKGLPNLRAQIWQVTGILKTSPNKANFERSYARMMGQDTQLDLFD